MALVRTHVSEERIASFIRMTKIGELGTMLAITSNQSMLRRNSVLYYNDILFLCSILQLLVITNIPSSPILVTLMMKAIQSSEMSVLEGGI
jgi:hypothetical protein